MSATISLGRPNKYSAETLKSFNGLTGYRLFKDGHVEFLFLEKRLSVKPFMVLKILEIASTCFLWCAHSIGDCLNFMLIQTQIQIQKMEISREKGVNSQEKQ